MKKLILLLLIMTTPLLANNHLFTLEQKAFLQEQIRETLVNNPEILVQAANAYHEQRQQQRQQQLQKIVKQNQNRLFNDPNSPRLGAAEAKLVMVYFTDYNCSFCKQFDPLLIKIVQSQPQVALIIKPLPFRAQSSVTAARSALSLWKQNREKFWLLHHRLMAKKGYHDNASIKAAEQKIGINLMQFDSQTLDTINDNLALAQQLDVQGTPATLIGSQVLSGAVSYEQLQGIVKTELEKLK
ncbi:DsbA family protein [Arsenophonus apicola]|uniref:DsbA family protein n=1 Tax=Arsenophonus apicola TaxID=2879119 RepID=A0ABY8P058_9GAMM|nr:DsbA family protein [Arsenophonus apicola]WGO82604.1 DsbA family protein [Arsenophonus apicola]